MAVHEPPTVIFTAEDMRHTYGERGGSVPPGHGNLIAIQLRMLGVVLFLLGSHVVPSGAAASPVALSTPWCDAASVLPGRSVSTVLGSTVSSIPCHDHWMQDLQD